MAELADALASGASGSNTMGVQLSLPALNAKESFYPAIARSAILRGKSLHPHNYNLNFNLNKNSLRILSL